MAVVICFTILVLLVIYIGRLSMRTSGLRMAKTISKEVDILEE
ncbi:MAG TPA: hypothetical protein VF131_13920 [Blastocatellia bacterium]|nr:hypothetical protein [Blastocatellia bacterium]